MSAKKSTLAIAAAGVLALAVVAYGFWRASSPAPEQFQGYMEAQETDIAAKISARVAEVAVKEGDRVERGSLLVRLDSPEVAAKMAQVQGALAAARAVQAKADRGARPQEITMAQLNWQRAQAAADLAEVSFRRVDNLAREGLVAEQKRDEARANYHASRDAALAARAQYQLALDGARPEDKEAAAGQAQQVAGALAEVEAAEAEVNLKSPVAGEITKVYAKVGELSPQGVAVATVVDLTDQWVAINVREDRLSRFAVGSSFEAELPALDRRRANFKVYYVAVLPDFATWRTTRASQGFDVRTFEVRARPEAPIDGARPGMSVLVR
ncbi:MAG: hypothetical protein ABS43_23315 [Bordetella sp. SCN 67-23]|nr:efflux RND transporter periplasmic adaptor subunit [Burkholderiales bacterium]ODS70356.1 MAG: hypothetical protein ABS43_23315 [Bordetella sp. SCN 67-23]OJW87843.1 MAG: hypothetical protein BGO71_10815 [Burkholderiales bacterium 67-32]